MSDDVKRGRYYGLTDDGEDIAIALDREIFNG